MFKWVKPGEVIVPIAEVHQLDAKLGGAVERIEAERQTRERRIAELETELAAVRKPSPAFTDPQRRALLAAYRAMTEAPEDDTALTRAAEGLRRQFGLFQEALHA